LAVLGGEALDGGVILKSKLKCGSGEGQEEVLDK